MCDLLIMTVTKGWRVWNNFRWLHRPICFNHVSTGFWKVATSSSIITKWRNSAEYFFNIMMKTLTLSCLNLRQVFFLCRMSGVFKNICESFHKISQCGVGWGQGLDSKKLTWNVKITNWQGIYKKRCLESSVNTHREIMFWNSKLNLHWGQFHFKLVWFRALKCTSFQKASCSPLFSSLQTNWRRYQPQKNYQNWRMS